MCESARRNPPEVVYQQKLCEKKMGLSGCLMLLGFCVFFLFLFFVFCFFLFVFFFVFFWGGGEGGGL